MNPIDFCRLTGYRSTIFLTFSFDALFFERIVLPSLRGSGNGAALVVADHSELSAVQASWPGQVVRLGRRYQVFTCSSAGAFHPKMIIRVGKNGGAVWVGSANVTFAGWSVNQELGTAWTFGEGKPDGGGWFVQLLGLLKRQGATDSDYICLEKIANERWVRDLDENSAPNEVALLTTFNDRPLAPQLAERWQERRFNTVRVMTGSTDAKGALLRHFQEQYGVTQASVLVDRGRCSFLSDAMDRLPIEVAVSAPETESSNPLHAKLYWFDGPDGPAAVFGSANCSAAAWLLDGATNGNHEAVVVYDNPDAEIFRNVLKLFDAELTSIELSQDKAKSEQDDSSEAAPVRVLSARLDEATSRLLVRFDSDPGAKVRVFVKVAGEKADLEPTMEDRRQWIAGALLHLDENITPLADVYISRDGAEPWILPVWVDDHSRLRESAQQNDLDEPFRNMGRAKTTTEQRNILKALQQVASAILTHTDLPDDPQIERQRRERPIVSSDDAEPVAIDPGDLIKSITDLVDQSATSAHGRQGAGFRLSPMGVMRALYEIDTPDSADPLQGEMDDDDQDDQDDADSQKLKKPKRGKSRTGTSSQPEDEVEIDEKFKDRLRVQTEQYIEKLAATEFADEVSATQLVQAAAYPLAVAVTAVKDGWASSETAAEWCRQTFEVLFRRQYPGRCNGLIRYVADRYRERDELSYFQAIVGDGTLWFALLSAMHHFSWEGYAGWIERAFVVRDIFQCRSLFASADPGRLRVLINRDTQLRLQEVLKVAPEINDVLERLELHVDANFDNIVSTQAGSEKDFKATDLMWNRPAGWGVFTDGESQGERYIPLYLYKRGEEKLVKKGYFVNVSKVAEVDSAIRDDISELHMLVAKEGG